MDTQQETTFQTVTTVPFLPVISLDKEGVLPFEVLSLFFCIIQPYQVPATPPPALCESQRAPHLTGTKTPLEVHFAIQGDSPHQVTTEGLGHVLYHTIPSNEV